MSPRVSNVPVQCSISLEYEMPEMYYVTSTNDKGCSRAQSAQVRISTQNIEVGLEVLEESNDF